MWVPWRRCYKTSPLLFANFLGTVLLLNWEGPVLQLQVAMVHASVYIARMTPRLHSSLSTETVPLL